MTVECPPCQWPTVLDERGPSDDPSILLTGAARIGDTNVQIVAIRVSGTLRWTPDYQRSVAEGSYHTNGLDEVLETVLEGFLSATAELGEFLGDTGESVTELGTGTYRIWVIPV